MWSSDGSRLAFVGREWESATLQYVDTYDRSNPVTKTSNERMIYREAVYTVKADGTDLRKLAWSDAPDSAPSTRIGVNDLVDPEEVVSVLEWSPEGKQIAFVAHYYGEPDGLYVANLDTSRVQQVLDLSTILEAQQYNRAPKGYRHLEGSIRGMAWSSDGSQIFFEVGGHRLDGDNRRGRSGLFALAADRSGLPLLLEEVDGDYVISYEESYSKWPVALIRMIPPPPRWYSPPVLDYLKKAYFLTETAPARIIMNTESKNENVMPEVEGWVLTTSPWGELDETVLVRIAGDRLVAASP